MEKILLLNIILLVMILILATVLTFFCIKEECRHEKEKRELKEQKKYYIKALTRRYLEGEDDEQRETKEPR